MGGGERVGGKPEGAADGSGTAVACSQDIDVGVANHDDLGGLDGMVAELRGFGDEGEETVGVGLFGVKAVATVVLEEEPGEVEVVADGAGRVDRLVGKERDGEGRMGETDEFEGFYDAGIDGGEVNFVNAVEVQKERDGFGYIFFVVNVAFGIAERTADEHGGTVAEVTRDDLLWQQGFAEVGEHGVDGVGEISARVDEGAVEVEDEELERWCGCHGTMLVAGGNVI